MKKRYECDLHCHTNRSDGNDSPIELIVNASHVAMKAIAIVDHDIDPPVTVIHDGIERDIKEFAKSIGIDLLLGCEFSCDTEINDVHIIGYELDWEDPGLNDEIKRARISKTEGYKKLCELLSKNGMNIDYHKELLGLSANNTNDHNKVEEKIEKKHIFELMSVKGYAKSWQAAKLMVRDHPFFNIKRPKINPVDALKIIKKAGGLSVLAHPYLIDEKLESSHFGKITRERYIDNLIGHGLDGIEALYTYEKTSYKGNLSSQEIKKEIKKKYSSAVGIFTGGSDYHHDGLKHVKNPRYMGEAGISYEEYKKIFLSYLV